METAAARFALRCEQSRQRVGSGAREPQLKPVVHSAVCGDSARVEQERAGQGRVLKQFHPSKPQGLLPTLQLFITHEHSGNISKTLWISSLLLVPLLAQVSEA